MDLKSMAQAIKSAPDLEKYGTKEMEYDTLIKQSKIKAKDKAKLLKITKTLIKPVKFPLSSKDSVNILEAIGKALQNDTSSKVAKK